MRRPHRWVAVNERVHLFGLIRTAQTQCANSGMRSGWAAYTQGCRASVPPAEERERA